VAHDDVVSSADLSQVGTEVSIDIDADAQLVWDLITDLSRTPEWNRETVSTVWVGEPARAVVGAVFRGTNRMGEWEWSVDCHIVVADQPHELSWTVLDPDHPSSTWWYRIDAPDDDHGVRLHHGFRHGPSMSGLRRRVEDDPAGAAATIAARLAMLEANMRYTLGCIKATAEADSAT
jgi:uncharacterized protein YndB with AHSA1/START domain